MLLQTVETVINPDSSALMQECNDEDIIAASITTEVTNEVDAKENKTDELEGSMTSSRTTEASINTLEMRLWSKLMIRKI